jgi:PhoPQ-activated pathogenicity-related protein
MNCRRLVAIVIGFAVVPAARAGLDEYIKKPEPAFAWKLRAKTQDDQGTIYDLHLVSQTWQNIKWEHQLQIYLPKDVEPNSKMLLWNTGGTAKPRDVARGMELAKKSKIPCAYLYGVPNQPLFDGNTEDKLIAYTFVKYLKTGDENWPLLFPMAKSVVKAMDALQGFSKQEWNHPVEKFIVAGGSKRGWTTWLSAAADKRVAAICPCVVDTLNMPKQMPHQLESFGSYSGMIIAYTSTGLVPMPTTPEAKKLWSMVDPYAYRDRVTIPKLLVNGNNDPYWSTDALNLYWDDLKGDKWVCYVPNAGHNLEQRLPGGEKSAGRALNTIAAFCRYQVENKEMPKLEWKHTTEGDQLKLDITSSQQARAARLWVAEADTRDFRLAPWREKQAQQTRMALVGTNPAKTVQDLVAGTVPVPKDGCLAFYGELEYEIDGIRYQLSTQLRIAGKPIGR